MKMLGMVPIEKLKPNEWNAIELPAEDEAKLKAQMRISGPEKTEALTVRRAGDVWEIVNGEKRWRIAKQLGWTRLPAVEIEISDYELKKYCLSYNLLRGTVNYVKLGKHQTHAAKQRANRPARSPRLQHADKGDNN